jgi:integrase
MPKFQGVYQDRRSGWYFKASSHKDPLTGRWHQITRRGFATAADASRARAAFLAELKSAPASPAVLGMTVAELIDAYLDDATTGGLLSAKTLFDYRHYTTHYIGPYIGTKQVRELDAETIAAWQRALAKGGSAKTGKGLSANTVRIARAPLAGALKYGVARGILKVNPMTSIPPPRIPKKVPQHWSPEQAREFLALHEGDRLLPVWGFLLGSGLRIGELVSLRWPNVELDRRLVRVHEFASVLGYEVVRSGGKSPDAVRTVDIDEHLVRMLRQHRKTQAAEALASAEYEATDFVFTRAAGGPYHPQTLSKMLARASVAAGLPRLTAHGLRHTSATLMLASGIAPKVAAERLGHADATLFSNLYSRVTPTMQREAAERIGAALFGA